MEVKSTRNVFERLGKRGCDQFTGGSRNIVCSYWLAGKCTKNPCRYLHTKASQHFKSSKRSQLLVSRPLLKPVPHKWVRESSQKSPNIAKKTPKLSVEAIKSIKVLVKESITLPKNEAGANIVKKTLVLQKRPNYFNGTGLVKSAISSPSSNKTGGVKYESGLVKEYSILPRNEDEIEESSIPSSNKAEDKSECGIVEEYSIPSMNESEIKNKISATKICENWISGTCVHGDLCQYSHSYFGGNGLSMLAKLEGHINSIIGISHPSDSDKLYSVDKDRVLRIWDCNTGECKHSEILPYEIGFLVSEGSVLYLGVENLVKVSDLKTHKQFTLNTENVGKIHAIVPYGNMLCAGAEDGIILVWKFTPEFDRVELIASMKGHTQGVTSLAIGACHRLYSGSVDYTIRVWDLNSFQCIQTLQGHSGEVTSVLSWNQCLLSCSLDRTIRAWAQTEHGEMELVHTIEDDHGFLALCVIADAESKPILLCSCGDNTVWLYNLPLFTERGRIFSKGEVRSIRSGPHGLFFTGDATGELRVWKLV